MYIQREDGINVYLEEKMVKCILRGEDGINVYSEGRLNKCIFRA